MNYTDGIYYCQYNFCIWSEDNTQGIVETRYIYTNLLSFDSHSENIEYFNFP